MPVKLPNPTISEIEPGLYLGDLGSSYKIATLTDNKITAMVSLSDAKSAAWSSPRNRELVPEDRHLYLPSLDTSTQDLLADFARVCDFIDSNREGNLLVHCTVGVSRSATVVIAYLMRKYHQSLNDTLALVKKSRKVKPNPNFMDQLAVWDEVQYEIWEDPGHTVPKKLYAMYLARRADALKAKGLTGNEPTCPDLYDNHHNEPPNDLNNGVDEAVNRITRKPLADAASSVKQRRILCKVPSERAANPRLASPGAPVRACPAGAPTATPPPQCPQSAQQRHCSYRRAMHRNGADVATASLSVDSGREVLPKNVKPLHYDVTLEPNFETFEYEGTVIIDFDVVEDSTSISLNTVDITIHETLVEADGATVSSTPTLEYTKDTQTTKISFPQTIKAGQKARLTQRFTGILNEDMAGFYRSSYKDENGNEKFLATTQMEATDARRAFPCLDEPALKATFTVTLIADHDLVCLSNMDVASERGIDSKLAGKKRKAITYNKTPIMSTYLLAFVIGDLQVYETDKFRLPVRVYCTPDQNIEHAVFSAELAARTLEFYEKQFGSQYPLPKMDMVAIPDFAAGAMENWGLITYRVVDLLLDEKTSSATTKKRVAEVVQHELAHQWFGNLVTMDFWDGLWLKEGFATWMSWYSSDVFYPEWRVWDEYVIDDLRSALSLDSLRSSHPIEVPVKRADEVNQIFDAISYQKGSCVLRMLSKYLGEDIFLEGIRKYLHKHAYGNTQTSDLWAALSEASGKDVEKVAGIWTRKVGFPVVTVTEDESNGTIHVKQNRFLRTADVKPEEDEVLYPVFLGLRTKDGLQKDLALNTREANFKVSDFDFFKLNSGHSGIYRTSYSTERLTKLGQNAKAGLLSVEDRAGMIADAGALASAGYQKTSGLLSLLKAFDNEDEYIVWDELSLRVGSLRDTWLFEDEKITKALKAFQLDLASKKANELGWEFTDKDDHMTQRFKALMFGKAAMAGDEASRAAAFEMFNKFIKGDRDAIQINLRSSVFAVALAYGGEAEYNALVKEYETGKVSSERNTALRSLGFAKDPALIQRTLDYSLSKEVRSQDTYMPISSLRAHKEGVVALWTWVKENWETLTKRLPPGMSMIGSVVAMATNSLTKEEQVADVKKFFGERSTKGFDLELAQSLDAIKAKQNWLARDREDVEQWLKDNKYL
ncbi:hypothetical protein G7046_g6422 [Stylonectria norvegica]|nr:hypothetical protein G7046_g6422 [Stylonectria norvegica]